MARVSTLYSETVTIFVGLAMRDTRYRSQRKSRSRSCDETVYVRWGKLK